MPLGQKKPKSFITQKNQDLKNLFCDCMGGLLVHCIAEAQSA